MSYIAFDLDALNVAPDVARAADLTEDRVIGGLSRLWAWCFRSATDRVTAIHIKGFFGADCTQVLSVFGFLEVDGADFRVKGADRYLRVKEARSQNGKAAAARGNLRRGKSVGGISPTAPSAPPNSAPTELQQASSPTPNTEHRTPNTEEKITTLSAEADPADPAWQVFGYWVKTAGKNARTAFDSKRRRAVLARLKDGYTVEDLCRAVDGCLLTPHNAGQNDRGERYDDLELICRDAAHVDRFQINATAPPRPRSDRFDPNASISPENRWVPGMAEFSGDL